jgi:hypothetical protein
MFGPNLDPGSSSVRRKRCPQQRDSLAFSRSRCRAFGVVVALSTVCGRAGLDYATVDSKSVPLEEEHT